MELEEIRRALVIGAGAMGHGIAIVYAISGRAVDLVDRDPAALDRARDRIRATLATLAEAGVIPASDVLGISGRIRPTTDLDAVAPLADIATEAIVEDRAAKIDLLVRLDGLLKPGAMIASNTSGLDVFSLV